MDVFVYSSPRLAVPRDEIEDARQEHLGNRGEITGGGSGHRGANIDVEVFDDESSAELLLGIKRILRHLGVPQDTYLDINGQRQDLCR